MTSVLRAVISSEDIARSIVAVHVCSDYRLCKADQLCACDTYRENRPLHYVRTRRAIQRLVPYRRDVFESYRVREDSEDPSGMVAASRPIVDIWFDDLVNPDGYVVPSAAGIALLLGSLPRLRRFTTKDEFLSCSSVYPDSYHYFEYVLWLARVGDMSLCSAVGRDECSDLGVMRSLRRVYLAGGSGRPIVHASGFAQLTSLTRIRVLADTDLAYVGRSSRWWAC